VKRFYVNRTFGGYRTIGICRDRDPIRGLPEKGYEATLKSDL
jgi:hypothetical protein